MKIMNKVIVTLIALFCIGNVSAYTWRFSNFTNKTVVVRVGLKAHPHWYYNIVKPHKGIAFNFGGALAGFCLHSIAWAEYNPNLKVANVTQNGGLDMLKAGETMIGREFGNVPYEYKDPEITYVESESAKAKKEAVKKNSWGGMLTAGYDLIYSLSKSPCESRVFAIVENEKGEVEFQTSISAFLNE